MATSAPARSTRSAKPHKAAAPGGAVTEIEVFGVLSLIFWALTIIVTLKYVLFLLRADNHGEGGTLALMALAQRAVKRSGVVILLGIVAAALFYGDAVITPALSVLSAVEGLEVVAPSLDTWVLPLSMAILLALFLVQSRGTAAVSAFFGPITVVWFLAIGFLGIVHIAGNPGVLLALSPTYGIGFLAAHGVIGLVTLGAVFLAVTGAEALYADLGHFGRLPIQTAWLGLVLPALVLNYFGQGALVLAHPETLENPFFLMAPQWAQLPMVVLATAATVIASQAVITGAYSLSRQAIQLGLLPRLEIRHTSGTQAGQIYMPRVNALLLFGVLLLVGLFRSSGALASAYGIAVTGTMVVTAMLAFIVVWKVWNWRWYTAAALVAPFLFIDLTFLSANLLKVVDGGWFPLLLGGLLIILMMTWRRGSRILFEKTRRTEVPLLDLVHNLEKHPPPRIAGTAVFLTSDPESTPTALLHSLKHFKVLHREQRHPHRHHHGSAEGRPRRAGDDRLRQPVVRAADAALRLHGNAERAEGAGRRQEARLELRHHGDVVLPVAALDQGGGEIGDAALAGPRLHDPRPQRRRRLHLLPHPDRTRGRDRHAGHGKSCKLPSRFRVGAGARASSPTTKMGQTAPPSDNFAGRLPPQ